jgi:hypothetical protein
MRIELKRTDQVKIKSWINDKPISTDEWEVFASTEGETETVFLIQDQRSGNKLKIMITRYENFEENN